MTAFRFLLALHAAVSTHSHLITAINHCGSGTVILLGNGLAAAPLASSGYSFSKEFEAWRIFLQTGLCGYNGDRCTVVEGSVTDQAYVDISLIPPLAFSVPVTFSYGSGATGRSCLNASCACNFDTYCESNDNQAIAVDSATNIRVQVTFCPAGNASQLPSTRLQPGPSSTPVLLSYSNLQNKESAQPTNSWTERSSYSWTGQQGSNSWSPWPGGRFVAQVNSTAYIRSVTGQGSASAATRSSQESASPKTRSAKSKCGLLKRSLWRNV